jgi:hypothetical protein
LQIAHGCFFLVDRGIFVARLLGWTLGTAIVVGATAWLYNELART